MTQTVWWYVEGTSDAREYLGRVSLRHHPATATIGEPGSELWVTVRPSRRGQGLGRRLLSAALPFAQANGITQAVVEVAEGNDAARRLITSAGAQPIAHQAAARNGRQRYLLPTT